MKIKEFFKKLFGCKEPEITTEMFTAEFPITENEAKCATITEQLTSNPVCGISEKTSVTADTTVKKPRKKRGRPRKKKKEE